MAADLITMTQTQTAKVLAPEDLAVGDEVAVLSELHEYISYFWDSDASLRPPESPVRIRWIPRKVEPPLKVRAVCLPFVLVQQISGKCQQLDIRQVQLARLEAGYAKLARKHFKREQKRKRGKGKKKRGC